MVNRRGGSRGVGFRNPGALHNPTVQVLISYKKIGQTGNYQRESKIGARNGGLRPVNPDLAP
jgi:hypothetical protein